MGGEGLFIQKLSGAVPGKFKMTGMAVLFVLGWELALKLCQLAERPIQKKCPCVSIPPK